MTNCVILCFVLYTGKEDFKERLCYINLPGRTTGSEIYLKNILVRETGKILSACGTESMTSYRLGVVAKIKEVAHKEMLFTHCITFWRFKCKETDLKTC